MRRESDMKAAGAWSSGFYEFVATAINRLTGCMAVCCCCSVVLLLVEEETKPVKCLKSMFTT